MKTLDNLRMAASGLGTDKFRTALSLSGVSIGIFTIVAVFTMVDSLGDSISEGLSQFGSDIVFVDQMPMEPDLNENGIFKWWEYAGRPQVSYDEYRYVSNNCEATSATAWCCYISDNETIGVSDGWELSIRNSLKKGRKFTVAEIENGAPVAIAGKNYLKKHKVDSVAQLYGRKVRIIGQFEESGINSVSLADIDASIVVPAKFAMSLSGFSAGSRCSLAARPAAEVTDEDFCAELRETMRTIRRLTPGAKDNFSINKLSFIIEQTSSLFKLIDKLGWIVGIFSLLVGGFGIANIMFVSVKDRTSEIGLQKALGASKRTIILQYLDESSILSLSGGAVGIVLVWLVTLLLKGSALPITLSAANVALGLGISLMIGIAAGVAPATAAANLHPADAIRQE